MPALERQRQEDQKFMASLSNTLSLRPAYTDRIRLSKPSEAKKMVSSANGDVCHQA